MHAQPTLQSREVRATLDIASNDFAVEEGAVSVLGHTTEASGVNARIHVRADGVF